MSNTSNSFTAIFCPGNSQIHLQLIFILHCLAGIACLNTALDAALQTLLLLILLNGFIFQLHYYKQQKSITLKFSELYGWQISVWKQPFKTIQIQANSVVSRWAIILNYEMEGRHKQLTIFKDALSAENYRKLRVSINLFHAKAKMT